ncbi:hypothetical protein [Terriglobus albidus]|uniref:hypothetical protein n=1 Tax=Terriglobus albidus TaxID=1592106 RepID=UPI0021E019BF|nr:hypothetical protein [Terriglobus albidus]
MGDDLKCKSADELRKWSDSRKFWAETCRTMILGAVGAFLSLKFISHVDDLDKALIGTQMTLRSNAVEAFIAASRQYSVAAGDFCAFNRNRDKFESENVDVFRTSLTRIQAYYAKRPLIIDQTNVARGLSDELFKKCNGNPDSSTKAQWHDSKKALDDANTKLASMALEELGQ